MIDNCWYKRDSTANWEKGIFHEWSVSYEEFETGPGQFAAAIVEEVATKDCHVVYAGHVSFADNNPEPPITEEQFNQVGKKLRFQPRLVYAVGGDTYAWLVQVHPETIEVFNPNAKYLCQVRWIDGKMDYSQGGLPLEELKKMFVEGGA